MNENDSIGKESIALRDILGGSTKYFFDEIWQRACVVYTGSRHNDRIENYSEFFNLSLAQSSPYQEVVRCGWNSLINLLENSRERFEYPPNDDVDPPLLFLDRELVQPEIFNNSLFHAYLNGCSVVINHADEVCPYLATLCQDLQLSLPHVYANTYLTPPDSQAVPPHADDRDVLIFQLHGKKRWRIYKNIPIPYPYPHEQVGKNGLDVPNEVLNGPLIIDKVLEVGDVLYMPRGFVHEAQTLPNEPSYHATIAVATHDWTLAGLMTTATQHMLHRNIAYRKGLPVHLGRRSVSTDDDIRSLQSQIDAAFSALQNEITAESVIRNLVHRYDRHNTRCDAIRNTVMSLQEPNLTMNHLIHDVGRDAARKVNLQSTLRVATAEEKESISRALPSMTRGLHVREAAADVILGILAQWKRIDGTICRVKDVRSWISPITPVVCDLTLLSFAKTCVELGALAVVSIN
jgi:Cupin superfamily protein